jgi:hypothetical protein
MHAPPPHTSGAGHKTPQPPQLLGSLATSVHAPLQKLGSTPFKHEQPPATHCWPPWQTAWQFPQLFGSVLGSTQAPRQSMNPAAHVVWQAPFWQKNPGPQGKPQPPQLFGSDERSTH